MKVAVIGTGSMGQHHVRNYAEMPDVTLVAVADKNIEHATALSNKFGCKAYSDYIEMLKIEKPDAVTIALPTVMHLEATMAALEAGANVLVEKPIADTVEDAKKMIKKAKELGLTLAVGHIERFNPAITELKKRLDQGQLKRIFTMHAQRQSPFPGRIQDVGVAKDLATHELDTMRYLAQSEVEQLTANVSQVLHDKQEDIVFGLLRFENKILGVLDVNWITPAKVRRIKVIGEAGMFVADYLTQELYFYANAAVSAPTDRGEWFEMVFSGVQEGDMIRYQIQKREPLRLQLESFIDSVKNKTNPMVSGEDGMKALGLALKIVECGTQENNCSCF